MGNCCSNEDERQVEVALHPKEGSISQNRLSQLNEIPINYGPLSRDEDNIPNTISFGQAVILSEGILVATTKPGLDVSTSYLAGSQISKQNYQPLEKSIRAVVDSPDRSNRFRMVQQQESGNFITEPLADNSRDTRSMELNKNLRTPSLSNSIYKGNGNITQELPFQQIQKNIYPISYQPFNYGNQDQETHQKLVGFSAS